MAKCYNALGRVYLQTEEVTKADDILLKCLDLWEKIYGLRHIKTAQALFYLGNAAFAAGNKNRSINLHKDAIVMMKEILGSDHIKVSLFLNTVAKDFIAKCDYSQALKVQNNALMILESHYGELHPEVIAIYGGLSNIAYA